MTYEMQQAIDALKEAVYLLGINQDDLDAKAGAYRVVLTLSKLTGKSIEQIICDAPFDRNK